jgi:hypothetical protein
MNLLTLKALAFDAKTGTFYSPSHTGFEWRKGIIAKECSKCTIDHCDPKCTCGIYSSPNPEVLLEYAHYSTSIIALMDTYGWDDIWTGPHDLPFTYVMRSWGTQIKGVVGTDFRTNTELSKTRQLSAMKACESFEVKAFPWFRVCRMIMANWATKGHLVKNPYDRDEWREINMRLQHGS